MDCLLWIRTSRHYDTLIAEIDVFEEKLSQPDSFTLVEVDEPFLGADHLLYLIHWPGTLPHLKVTIAPLMASNFITDWSLTEVGHGLTMEYDPEGSSWDRRYRDGDFDPEETGYSALNWAALDYDADGATVLWVDLVRDRLDRDYLMNQIEWSLPKPVTRLWHGRSSMAFGFTSSHDLGSTAPYGLSGKTLELLGAEDCANWLAFQVGNRSVGGVIETMNPMADFIWRRRPARRRTA